MNHRKKWSKIERMCEACILFSQGKITLEQVHRKFQGPKRTELILSYPNIKLGYLLYFLCCDFYTWYGQRNDIIENQILQITNYLCNSLKLEAENGVVKSDVKVIH